MTDGCRVEAMIRKASRENGEHWVLREKLIHPLFQFYNLN